MSKDFVYNSFVKYFLNNQASNPVNLEAKNTYKLALLTSCYDPDMDEDYNYTHDTGDGINSFFDLQVYEVEDKNESYEPGGKYIKFIDLNKNQYGIRDEESYDLVYDISEVFWPKVDIQNIKYAVTYRASDGLLISCHEFKPLNIKNDGLRLTWLSSPAIIISPEYKDKSVELDSNLDRHSSNALENKTITDAFKELGVIFTDDLGEEGKCIPVVYPDEEREEWENDITHVTSLKRQDIFDIFDEINPPTEENGD